MAEVNVAYVQGRYEKNLKSLCIMSNIKVFASQDGLTSRQGQAGWPDKHDWLHTLKLLTLTKNRHVLLEALGKVGQTSVDF